MLHNFGSINLDHFYRVSHLVGPGETLACHDYRIGLGGKGANQSLALARAGAEVSHWGRVGREGDWARDVLARAGVDVAHVARVDEAGGHAIIQVDDQGENAIVLFAGANHGFSDAALEALVASTRPGDWLLTQNECNGLPRLMALAIERGLALAFNPAPMSDAVLGLPLSQCRLLFLNRGEAARLAGVDESEGGESLLDALCRRLPDSEIVLTLGSEGAWYQHAGERLHQPAVSVTAVDTTGAGDTFIGYFLAARQQGHTVARCLQRAAMAAALSVQRPGAAESIPARDEVERVLHHGPGTP